MHWPTCQRVITQRFGEHPRLYRKFGLPGHEGIDLAAQYRSAVCAVADGVVSAVRLEAFADPMLRPYGNQVRVQHMGGYETIYAHLAQAVVVRGQSVTAGQLIGLAGNTGFSAKVHLHLGLKRHGATVYGETTYPYDFIDPEPFLVEPGEDEADREVPEPSLQLRVGASSQGDGVEVRSLPFAEAKPLAKVEYGTVLGALEQGWAVRQKVGRKDQWLWVRTPEGEVGWVAARYLSLLATEPKEAVFPVPVTFVIVEAQRERLKLRAGPGLEHAEILRLADGTWLRALEARDVVEEKVGKWGQWLHVQAPGGQVGYCAAWYLVLEPPDVRPVLPGLRRGEPTAYVVVESPELGLRLRAGPGTEYKRIWWMPHGTVLNSLEDPVVTGKKVGQRGEWIHVRTPALYEGYAAAWYLRHPTEEDRRPSVDSDVVCAGLSPHIFGIHAVSVADEPRGRDQIRQLYERRGKRGWILFTEICGRHARAIQFVPEIRRRLWDWVDRGYGVIIRLNYGYEPGGTLPESRFYDDFAAAAARWVALYLRDRKRSPLDYTWTIQIANEQNNPREHPGGFEHPIEHITPQRYAEAFNKTYARIKRVLPNTIVCPGAIDPYNYMPMRKLGNVRWRPLDYFTTMLAHIDALDGIVLHAYTHGPNPEYVTHLKRFGDGTGPLGDHYYDFQAYRTFMERIPAKWRDVPVYITEMDHLYRPAGEHDLGWINRNVGWVRAVYEEIDRWNRQPYAQQIRCGLLYRWMGDAWAIKDKGAILEDFEQAMAHDYRWRGPSVHVAFAHGAEVSGREPALPQLLGERFLTYPDDFTRIWGIGEKAQAALRAAGIFIYEQLAQLTPSQLEMIIAETGLHARYLSTWPEQARVAASGEWHKLQHYREIMGDSRDG